MARRRTSLIEKELKQQKPFRSLSQEAVVGLIRTGDIVRRSYYAVVEQGGLSPQQYNVLRILRGAGPEGLPTLEIAERLLEKSPGITRFIDQLDSLGLLERRRSVEDRRRVYCTITQAGRTLIDKMDKPVDTWDHQSLSMFSQKELKTLIELLDRVRLHYAEHDSKSDRRPSANPRKPQRGGRGNGR